MQSLSESRGLRWQNVFLVIVESAICPKEQRNSESNGCTKSNKLGQPFTSNMEPLVLYAPRVKIFQMHVSVFFKEPRIDQELNENKRSRGSCNVNYY